MNISAAKVWKNELIFWVSIINVDTNYYIPLHFLTTIWYQANCYILQDWKVKVVAYRCDEIAQWQMTRSGVCTALEDFLPATHQWPILHSGRVMHTLLLGGTMLTLSITPPSQTHAMPMLITFKVREDQGQAFSWAALLLSLTHWHDAVAGWAEDRYQIRLIHAGLWPRAKA